MDEELKPCPFCGDAATEAVVKRVAQALELLDGPLTGSDKYIVVQMLKQIVEGGE